MSQILQLAPSADRFARRNIIDLLRKAADSLEDNIGTIHRFGHIVRSEGQCRLLYIHTDTDVHQDLEKAAIQLGFDLSIFKYLAQANDPKSVEEVAEQANASPQLISMETCDCV